MICNEDGTVLRYYGTASTSLKEVEQELRALGAFKLVCCCRQSAAHLLAVVLLVAVPRPHRFHKHEELWF